MIGKAQIGRCARDVPRVPLERRYDDLTLGFGLEVVKCLLAIGGACTGLVLDNI